MLTWTKREEGMPDEAKPLLCCNRHGNRFLAQFNRWNGAHWDAFGLLRVEYTDVAFWMAVPDPRAKGLSCREELPDEGTTVLCATRRGGVFLGRLKRGAEPFWEAYGALRMEFQEVSHWMTIPDAPLQNARDKGDWVA